MALGTKDSAYSGEISETRFNSIPVGIMGNTRIHHTYTLHRNRGKYTVRTRIRTYS